MNPCARPGRTGLEADSVVYSMDWVGVSAETDIEWVILVAAVHLQCIGSIEWMMEFGCRSINAVSVERV